MSTVNIMAIVGSLRKGSVNGTVAQAAAAAAIENVQMDIFDITDVPLYDGDIEESGLPDVVQQMHDRVSDCDGLMIFSPEYNGSFPAVTKNAIDWFSRPPKRWEGTPIAMVVASPGPRVGLGVRTHFEEIIAFHPVLVYPSLGIGAYGDKVTNGELTDPTTQAELVDYVASFAAFCREG